MDDKYLEQVVDNELRKTFGWGLLVGCLVGVVATGLALGGTMALLGLGIQIVAR